MKKILIEIEVTPEGLLDTNGILAEVSSIEGVVKVLLVDFDRVTAQRQLAAYQRENQLLLETLHQSDQSMDQVGV